MSAYPLMLEGTSITALVVGGGAVATRKTRALLDAGARVRLVSPEISPELALLVERDDLLSVTRAPYEPSQLDGATFVIAATNDSSVNAAIARDARERGLLVNVVDAPESGTCVTPAVYRNGELVVAVSTGRVPSAAARIRDRIAVVLDHGYADALRALGSMRRTLLSDGKRDAWHEAARELIGDDFCAHVESGEIETKVAQWR